jgi:hypothetical protein
MTAENTSSEPGSEFWHGTRQSRSMVSAAAVTQGTYRVTLKWIPIDSHYRATIQRRFARDTNPSSALIRLR